MYRSSYLKTGIAPTLVLIPGSFNDAYALGGIIDGLDESMQLAVVEVRGHGGGWPPPRGGSIEQFAQDALRVIDALGVLLSNIQLIEMTRNGRFPFPLLR